MIDPAVTACWHSACKKCLEDFVRHHISKGNQPRCFSCRAPVDAKDIFEVVKHPSTHFPPEETPDDVPNSFQQTPRISLRRIHPLSPSAHTSAKIHALINGLSRVQPGTKTVVFSQFTSFLDLIGPQLTKVGIAHLRLDGTMPHKARAAVLAEFTKTEETYADDIIDDEDEQQTRNGLSTSKATEPPPSVLLISLRAGGVGLNLTSASNVFLMDPWWSFAIEAQAIDRVHRMGQLRDVQVTRFVVKDSIEGRMLRIQERKMNIAGSLGLRVGGDESEDDKRKDRIAELKMLFE
jgi:DNA repair protein RAD5